MALLIFDCDGVLIDSEILHSKIEVRAGKELLGIDRTIAEHQTKFCGTGLKGLYAGWEADTGKPLPPGLNDEINRRKNEAFATEVEPTAHIREMLTLLNDIPRCVATGTPLPTIEIVLRATGLYDLFAPHIFTADMVKRGKPAPDIFLFAARQMGAAPEECLVIEDSIFGTQAGVAAGMTVIGYTGGGHCGPDHGDKLRALGAHHIIGDMRELPPLAERHFASAKRA